MIRTLRIAIAGSTFALLCLLMQCEYIYTPEKQPLPEIKDENKPQDLEAGTGVIYKVNTGQQTCNPSMSPNALYPGCLLWLGFSSLNVSVPDSQNGYDVSSVKLHDRLTVTDTNNAVRWYIMLDQVGSGGEFQGPEWSTHPDYIASLIGIKNRPYDGYVIRLSDKESVRFCAQQLNEFSYPHIWLPDSLSSTELVESPDFDENGFLKKDQIVRFFGGENVKIAFSRKVQSRTIFYLDYSRNNSPSPVPLQKPEGYSNWDCNSPLISPDGDWVTYHCYGSSTQGRGYNTFIQRLAPDTEAHLIAEEASDPHWWADPISGDYFIIYASTPGAYFTQYDFSDSDVEKQVLAGTTYKQRLKSSRNDDSSLIGELKADSSSAPFALIHLPFKGGLSNDGRYLGTAYKFAYILKLD